MKGMRIRCLLLAAGLCASLFAGCNRSDEIRLFDDSPVLDGVFVHDSETEQRESSETETAEITPESSAQNPEQSMITREDVWGKYDLETLFAIWEQKMTETAAASEFTPKICEDLEKQAQSTEPADVSVEENVITFSVKTTREDSDVRTDVTLAGGEYVLRLLYEMRENGVLYPYVTIVCTCPDGELFSQTWGLPDVG